MISMLFNYVVQVDAQDSEPNIALMASQVLVGTLGSTAVGLMSYGVTSPNNSDHALVLASTAFGLTAGDVASVLLVGAMAGTEGNLLGNVLGAAIPSFLLMGTFYLLPPTIFLVIMVPPLWAVIALPALGATIGYHHDPSEKSSTGLGSLNFQIEIPVFQIKS
jgi:hypothetical protein